MLRPGGKYDGIHGSCRRPTDNRKRIGTIAWQQLRDCLEHTNLKRATRAAARQDERRSNVISMVVHAVCSGKSFAAVFNVL